MDPYAIAANAVEQIINSEFADEQPEVLHDELHESLGQDGIYVGIAPVRAVPVPNNRVAQHTLLHVQFFDLWEKRVDPHMIVDPRRITDFAYRLQDAIRRASVTANGNMWYFQWEGTEFPRDPVGNKTRFDMTIRAWGNNAALVETTG